MAENKTSNEILADYIKNMSYEDGVNALSNLLIQTFLKYMGSDAGSEFIAYVSDRIKCSGALKTIDTGQVVMITREVADDLVTDLFDPSTTFGAVFALFIEIVFDRFGTELVSTVHTTELMFKSILTGNGPVQKCIYVNAGMTNEQRDLLHSKLSEEFPDHEIQVEVDFDASSNRVICGMSVKEGVFRIVDDTINAKSDKKYTYGTSVIGGMDAFDALKKVDFEDSKQPKGCSDVTSKEAEKWN